ncbi:MAG: hypothetical protein ACRD0U_05000, partial [Acidimicrobiales bacterium]
MPLTQLPRIERLDLARIELPADHPAADLGRSISVHGFLIDHPEGAILVETGVGFGNDFIDELYQPSRHDLEGLPVARSPRAAPARRRLLMRAVVVLVGVLVFVGALRFFSADTVAVLAAARDVPAGQV